MSAEAIAYLLSQVDILAGEEVLKKQKVIAKLGGVVWIVEKEIEERDIMVKRCCSLWASKVPKIVNILNPDHDDFSRLVVKCMPIVRGRNRLGC